MWPATSSDLPRGGFTNTTPETGVAFAVLPRTGARNGAAGAGAAPNKNALPAPSTAAQNDDDAHDTPARDDGAGSRLLRGAPRAAVERQHVLAAVDRGAERGRRTRHRFELAPVDLAVGGVDRVGGAPRAPVVGVGVTAGVDGDAERSRGARNRREVVGGDSPPVSGSTRRRRWWRFRRPRPLPPLRRTTPTGTRSRRCPRGSRRG